MCVCVCVCVWCVVRDRCLSLYVPCIYPHIYLIIVLWEAVIVGRDGRDKLRTGRRKQTCPQRPSSLPSAVESSCPETSPSAAS